MEQDDELIGVDYVVSLGKNCRPHWHLHRRKMQAPFALPFDQSIIDHPALCQLLRSELKAAFTRPEAHVKCPATGLLFAHQSLKELKPTMDRWKRRRERFLAIRDRPLLFIRELGEIREREVEPQKKQLEAALKACGFENFRIIYTGYLVAPGVFHMTEKAKHWYGISKEWDELLDHIKTYYHIGNPRL